MNTEFGKIARELFDLVGSEENILFVENCMTRLRLRLKDTKKVDVGILKKIESVRGVVETREQFQIIIDNTVAKILISEFINIYRTRK
ncbi:PTS transporter subunit EIIB [Clostridium beijerinckii]|uniref:PTS transporter subunit EIIB n=1 Tax=Clostridium beijerinckii TaxID=1520 RepID=UPI00098C43ED|nr:PTS glucose/sucrose transporter subunit IIB [Clostridium beijerinckii]MBA8933173.1 PTS system beta-glucosides-specific IIC component/PTS system sucrose-specific IIC component/PTS system trehalose-specific IIC component [Clostridium beijerinckii]NRT36880.1 PTS system beta-glucosides-specific IIC component/PTS system sucrose-specific IIC component/PTS system trehalose-specific IIC component [Clostridium beijerinckii]NRT43686.1 PTS system beta-glucosides-specific IIC component/PTS system sucrose